MNLLIKNAAAVFCHQQDFCHQQKVIPDLRISGGRITEIGPELHLQANEKLIDASGCAVYPGFINTHHHLAQTAFKAVEGGLNAALGEWLAEVPYQFWPYMSADTVYWAAALSFYEMLRSGVTTCADHHYLYHRQSSMELEDAVWQAASDTGIKLVLCRGGATQRGTHRGLKNLALEPESLAQMIERLEYSLTRYHQGGNDAMRRLVVAPTSIMHSSSADDLKVLAEFARTHHLRMHSHLLEVVADEEVARASHGMAAHEYAEQCGWLGDDVWFAHLVHADDTAIEALARTGTGIAHCPTSNCRLGSGVAPIVAMQKAGVPVSIGVDGSASSESGSMLQEVNLAWLLHRAIHGVDATRVEQVIHWATAGGARVLGLERTGTIAEGMAADLVLWDLNNLRYAGVQSLLYAPVICGEPASVKWSIVNGVVVIENGELLGVGNMPRLILAELREKFGSIATTSP